MEEYTEAMVELTDADRAVLESYKGLCDGLSDYLGDGYEFVLHSLEDFDKSVIKIINGSYTGRKEGAPITDLALSMLGKIKEEERHKGHISYFSKNKKGEPLHSCTITIEGENKRVIGLLCINFYLNTPMHKFLGNLFEPAKLMDATPNETFVDTASDLITESINQIRSEVLDDMNITTQNRNKEIITRLADRGIFKLKDSVVQCAEILGISKNTVYMHLRNMGN